MVDERKKVIEDVDKDRRYAIDAAIVRIMKSRKVLGHQQLVGECVDQLNRMFKVWFPDVMNYNDFVELFILILLEYLFFFSFCSVVCWDCIVDWNFQPDIKAIKKRIEDLITRDYLERDKENPSMFRYLA